MTTEPLTVEIEGRTYTEVDRGDPGANGNFWVKLAPAPLTLDDYARVAYETAVERHGGTANPIFDDTAPVTKAAWRSGIAAAFAAAGHPLPDAEDAP